MQVKEVKRCLDRVDWDFPGSTTLRSSVHSLHWFPANLLPQIPAYLVRILSNEGDLVLDPFCGSGTVGIEALDASRKVWQGDVCRAAIQVARGKLPCSFRPSIAGDLRSFIDKLNWDRLLVSDQCGRTGEGSDPELRSWFSPQTYEQLLYIWNLVERREYLNSRSVLEMIFSDVLFACASTAASRTATGKKRRHHWGWIADNVKPKNLINHNAVGHFRRRLQNALDVIATSRVYLAGQENTCDLGELRRENAKNTSVPDNSVDLIVTSPPYLGMTDYTLANRLTYLWMGWPLSDDFREEIGSRRNRNRKMAKAEYLDEMHYVWAKLSEKLRPNGLCAIVIGASRKFSDASEALIDLISDIGLELLWGPRTRIRSRQRVGNKSTRLDTAKEFICVWRKNNER